MTQATNGAGTDPVAVVDPHEYVSTTKAFAEQRELLGALHSHVGDLLGRVDEIDDIANNTAKRRAYIAELDEEIDEKHKVILAHRFELEELLRDKQRQIDEMNGRLEVVSKQLAQEQAAHEKYELERAKREGRRRW